MSCVSPACRVQDARGAADMLPFFLETERALLDGLARHGESNPLGALSSISPRLRTLFVHSFQVRWCQQHRFRRWLRGDARQLTPLPVMHVWVTVTCVEPVGH